MRWGPEPLADVDRLTDAGSVPSSGSSAALLIGVDGDLSRTAGGTAGIDRRSVRRHAELSIEDRIRCACCSKGLDVRTDWVRERDVSVALGGHCTEDMDVCRVGLPRESGSGTGCE